MLLMGETVMENGRLPPELERLERNLLSGPQVEPSAALRQRVLRGVRAELYCDRILPRWRFAAAAAAVFVWLSLSLTAARAIDAALAPGQPHQSVREVAKRVQQLSPELSPEESLREAMLFQSAAELGSRISLEDRLYIAGPGEFYDAQRGRPRG